MELNAECIVVVPQGRIMHMTIIKPDAASEEVLKKGAAWQNVETLTINDINAHGVKDSVTLNELWFIDCRQADSKINVLMVRFIKRGDLRVHTSHQPL